MAPAHTLLTCRQMLHRPLIFGATATRRRLPSPRKLLSAVAVVLIASSLCAGTTASSQPASHARYLFLVEASAVTAPHKAALAEAVSSRILSGLDGQMRSGDVFLVGLYSEELLMDRYFPAAWDPSARHFLAEQIALGLDGQVFAGEARLDRVLAALAPAIAQADNLLILICASSQSRVAGTPFDDKINKLAARVGPMEPVLITSLMVKRGRIAGWAVERINTASPKAPMTKRQPPARAITSSPPARTQQKLPPLPVTVESTTTQASTLVETARSITPEAPPVQQTVPDEVALPSAQDRGDLPLPLVPLPPDEDREPAPALEPALEPAPVPAQAEQQPQPQPEIQAPAASLTVASTEILIPPSEKETLDPVHRELRTATATPPHAPAAEKESIPPPAPALIHATEFFLLGFGLLVLGLAGFYFWKRKVLSEDRSSLITRSLGGN
jgi:hypothetical protein